MHYYQFNIADYQSHTKHLTPIEDICYRRLLDWQYMHEKPITTDINCVCRLLMLKEYSTDVEQVLNEFFILTEDGWINSRAFEEILKFHESKKNHWSYKLTKIQRCVIQANRNASKIKASPSWLTKDHKFQISEIYSKAAIKTAETGIAHEVDHIIPLRGKVVCGLHVPWNLQVLPAYKNRQKSNLLEIS